MKKWIVWLLTAVMLLQLVPFAAAEEAEPATEPEVTIEVVDEEVFEGEDYVVPEEPEMDAVLLDELVSYGEEEEVRGAAKVTASETNVVIDNSLANPEKVVYFTCSGNLPARYTLLFYKDPNYIELKPELITNGYYKTTFYGKANGYTSVKVDLVDLTNNNAVLDSITIYFLIINDKTLTLTVPDYVRLDLLSAPKKSVNLYLTGPTNGISKLTTSGFNSKIVDIQISSFTACYLCSDDTSVSVATLTAKKAGRTTIRFTFHNGDSYAEDYMTVYVTDNGGFTDISTSAYYYDALGWALQKNIATGTSSTKFSPNANCTRAQVVTFLWRAKGKPSVSGSNPFKDVSKSDYFYSAVLWAVKKGITDGMGNGKFMPNRSCTRGQVATFLWRCKGKPSVSGSNPFSDVQSGDYFYDAVIWASSKGITTGTTSTTFEPDKTCTRAQTLTLLYRAFG